MNRPSKQLASHPRRGSMVPALAMALFVVGGALAFVFDRLWQDAAAIELRTAGEAAALAAAAQLASDDTLRANADWRAICESARLQAAAIAAENRVGGSVVTLDTGRQGDVRCGRLIENAVGEEVFVETIAQPNVAYVRARQGRGSSNPVGLLTRDLTGAGRLLEVIVGATAENRITGLRPYEGVNVPALPIALFAGSGLGPAVPGWNTLVESRRGPDAWRVGTDGHSLEAGGDGLHEMLAVSAPYEADEKQQLLATVHVIDVGTQLNEQRLVEQCRTGWSRDDFEQWSGELRCDGAPQNFTSKPKIPAAVRREISNLIGETRICWLFDSALPTANPDRCQVVCSRLAAIRILAVQDLPDGLLALQVQPTVIVTRTAMVSSAGDDRLKNPYVYKLSLSE